MHVISQWLIKLTGTYSLMLVYYRQNTGNSIRKVDSVCRGRDRVVPKTIN